MDVQMGYTFNVELTMPSSTQKQRCCNTLRTMSLWRIIMKLSNTTEHLKVGAYAGVTTGFLLPILHMEMLWLAMIITAFVLMVLFELWQWKMSANPNYLKLKWLDCIVDIMAGWIAFSVPVTILCYALACVK